MLCNFPYWLTLFRRWFRSTAMDTLDKLLNLLFILLGNWKQTNVNDNTDINIYDTNIVNVLNCNLTIDSADFSKYSKRSKKSIYFCWHFLSLFDRSRCIITFRHMDRRKFWEIHLVSINGFQKQV